MQTPIREAIMRRRNGEDIFCLYLEDGITDDSGHPGTGVFPEQQNFHGNIFRN